MLLEREEVKFNPLSLIQDGHLQIKTKAGELCVLQLNKAQQYILKRIQESVASGKPSRFIILKARQLGCSTLIEAILYAITSQQPNNNALIIADDEDGSDYLFEMSKLYQEKCPLHLKPTEKKSNAKKLEFDLIHSQILIDTAKNKDAGRKYTFRLVHLSEYAFFPYPSELMLGLNQAVPSLPGTLIVKESTANGFNHFKEEWDKAVNHETDYEPIFIPWYWDEGYQMPSDGLGALTSDEIYLQKLMISEGITLIEERLAWRRWCIRNNCEGSTVLFQQEYPSTPEEAFIASGRGRFDAAALKEMYLHAEKPTCGYLELKNGCVEFVENEQGPYEVYKFPTDSTHGAIGVDVSEGIGNDRSSASFLNYETLQEDIVLNTNKLDPGQFAKELYKLGHWCNKALVAVENNGPGLACILPLRNGTKEHPAYRNIYFREVIDEVTKKKTKKFGWHTDTKTKPIIIDKLAEFIRESVLRIRSQKTIRELQTFIIEEDGKMNAMQGCNDDRVMSLAIACMMYALRPTCNVPKTIPPTKRIY